MSLLSSGALSLAGSVVGAGTSVSEGKKNRSAAQQAAQASDPFGPYRAQYAGQLQNLMANPNSAMSMPNWQPMQQAAARTEAAQGYTGSGNALAAAASAGGQAYQQDFNNLALLSGAGIAPGMSQVASAGQIIGANNAEGGQLAQILGNLTNPSNGGGKPVTGTIDQTGWGPNVSAGPWTAVPGG